jgi:CheY-like chemotaxis protein
MIEESELLRARILIVDDQEANVELLTQMLQNSGFTNIDSTQRPQEVCALHQEHRYDLILLDLLMPEMDGFAVMQALKDHHHTSLMHVIVITAQPDHKLRALQSGARDFISKPFDLAELRTRIRNTLEVCLIYQKLEDRNEELEARVQERTTQLIESEARFRSLTELASDWYWEQDEHGTFTKLTGPVREMLGMAPAGQAPSSDGADSDAGGNGWDASQHAQLKAFIAARQPFLDFILRRTHPDGSVQTFQISGEPMFDRWNKFTGYHGLGLEITARQ